MTYSQPVLTVEWMPDVWPGCDEFGGVTPIYNAFTSPAWVPLPAEVESFSMRRGRATTTDEFKGGTAHLEVFNPDGSLDPLAPGSVTADTYGCPVRIMADYDGVRSPVFTGFVDGPWVPSWGRGRRRTVSVDLVDWLGRSAIDNLPGAPANLRNHTWSGSPPHAEFVWWRGSMSASAAAAANDATIWDWGRGENHGEITSGLVTAVAPILGCDFSSLELAVDTRIESTDLITSTDNVHASAAMILPDSSLYTGEQTLLSFVNPSGVPRWAVGVDSIGRLWWRLYNASGSPVVSHLSTFAYSAQAMIVAISIDYAAGLLRPWEGASVPFSGASQGSGRLVVSGTSSGPSATVTVGNVTYSGGSTHLRPMAVTAPEETGRVKIPKGTGNPWSSSTAQPVQVDMPPVAPRPVDAEDLTVPVSVFAPLQAFLQAIAAGMGGAVYVRRDGWIVLRSGDDLGWWPPSRGQSDPVDDGLYQVVAQITDSPTPAPIVGAVTGTVYDLPVLRYSGPGHDGLDPDRVINSVDAGMAQIVAPSSVRRYGLRPVSLTPEVQVTPGYVTPAADGPVRIRRRPTSYPIPVVPDDPMATQAAVMVATRRAPTAATPQVTLQPWGDTAITDFVLTDLDLETRVVLTQSDQVTGVPIIDAAPVRVQGESWHWAAGGTEWTVTLDLAPAIPDR